MSKPFNSKVIKSFIPELRSRKYFFVFRDSYVLCIYVMNILCTFHTYPYHRYIRIPPKLFRNYWRAIIRSVATYASSCIFCIDILLNSWKTLEMSRISKGEWFHQVLKVTEEWYQGRWAVNIMADYYRTINQNWS